MGALSELREYAKEQRDAARENGNRAGALAFDDIVNKTNELEREAIADGIPIQLDLSELDD